MRQSHFCRRCHSSFGACNVPWLAQLCAPFRSRDPLRQAAKHRSNRLIGTELMSSTNKARSPKLIFSSLAFLRGVWPNPRWAPYLSVVFTTVQLFHNTNALQVIQTPSSFQCAKSQVTTLTISYTIVGKSSLTGDHLLLLCYL